jgi:hypothetical protein
MSTVDGIDAVDAVDVHTDLMCPWAYQASLWLRSVRAQTGLRVRWRWFSLADHRRVADLGGFGVPTLVFAADRALFGPVVREAPDGASALRLWDLVTGWLEFPALYEVRRPKTSGDWARIGDRFAPYLSARDWPTIQNEVL